MQIGGDRENLYFKRNITYDGSGNPLSYYNGSRYTFTWEEDRRLTSAVKNGSNYTYTYDSTGLRTSKTVDGVTHNYLYASGKLLRESYGNTVLDFFYDSNGFPYALNYTVDGATTTYYYITNLQGDVMYLVTTDGHYAASYEYNPYGEVLGAAGTMGQINPLRYRGYYYDSELSLYYLQSRYYDPTIGRFINADSYVSTGQGFLGNNMFAYCLNNPVNYVDHNGKNADALRTWASAMWWLCTTDSALPIGDIIYVFGFLVCCVDAFSTTRNDVQPVTFHKIDWNGGNKNHILKGTDNKHINGWRRFGLNPQDPNSWSTLLPILMDIVENTSPYDVQQGKGGGWVYYYAKTFLDIGVKVVVKIWVSADGFIQKLSDAIPYIVD